MLGAEVDLTVDVSTADVLEAHEDRLRKAGELGFAVSQEEVPVDRGTLKASGFGPEKRDRGETMVIGYSADHAAAMEFGTDPGEYPPIEPLERWGERIGKGADFGRWVATVKIPEEGITPQPYLQPAAERMSAWLNNHGLDL